MFGLKQLPDIIPVFPLTGVLLLPKGHLPLNIFESRYLDMVFHAREKNGLIGMIQPLTSPLGEEEGNDLLGTAPRNRKLYSTGCVGMISEFDERKDGRVHILLTGLSRFDVVEEMPQTQMFREMRVRYDKYYEDCTAPFRADDLPRQKLVLTVEKYLKLYDIRPKWELLEQACDEELINAMAMICPFDKAEKQALLEILSLRERAELMITMMEFTLTGGQSGPIGRIM